MERGLGGSGGFIGFFKREGLGGVEVKGYALRVKGLGVLGAGVLSLGSF